MPTLRSTRALCRVALVAALVLANLSLALSVTAHAQTPVSPRSLPDLGVPGEQNPPAALAAQHSVVRWSGAIPRPQASPFATQMRFAIYAEQSGGLALWSETQPVQVGADGRYSVLLGVGTPEGLPVGLFPAGEPRWIEALPADTSNQGDKDSSEAPRSLLTAVPYAFHSVDAETLAGRAASDYVTHEDLTSLGGLPIAPPLTADLAVQPAISGTGATNYLPIWTSSTTFGNSALYQTNGYVGIGTAAPLFTLDVNGEANVRGVINLPTSGTSTKTAGYASHSLQFGASTFESSTSTAIAQNFRLQATPVGNNTTTPTSALELLYGAGTAAPTATGFSIAANGKVTFVAGQTFPGAGNITKITPTSPLTGGGTTGTVTLGLNTTALETTLDAIYPQRALNNTFTGENTFTGYTLVETPSSQSIALEAITSFSGGSGVLGQLGAASTIGSEQGNDAGVWGDAGQKAGTGVTGTADDGEAGYFINNSPSGYPALQVDSRGAGLPASFYGTGGSCNVNNSGDLSCTGSKSAVVPVDDKTRMVALYAVESPENWFEDFGSGQLSNGVMTVKFESTFAQTVNLGADYKVFLTPNGDCKGLYVTNKTATSFEVRELGSGKSAVAFDYRIIARRKGYETIRLADRTKEMDRSKSPIGRLMKAQPAAR